MEEPTDEILSIIIQEAATEASSSTAKTQADYFKEISIMLLKKIAVMTKNWTKSVIDCILP